MAKIENFQDPNWVTAKVWYTSKGVVQKPRTEVVNLETKQRYLHEPMSATAGKAGLLATVGIPFYTMANVAMQVVRLATMLISLVVKTLVELLTGFSFEALKKVIVNITYEIPAAIVLTIWSVVKAPICAIGMEFCAICAVVSPLKWRVHLGNIEAFWRGTDRKHHLFDKAVPDDAIEDFFFNPHTKYGFFLAYCFQPWGSLDDANVLKNADGTPRYQILQPRS